MAQVSTWISTAGRYVNILGHKLTRSGYFREEAKMALETYTISITEVAEISLDHKIIGKCYAFESGPITEQAKAEGMSFHELILGRIIAGLWHAHPKFRIFVYYEVLGQIDRLFICSLRRLPNSFFNQVHPKLSDLRGYIESGRDATVLKRVRPLALWESPCTMIALWPKGFEGETDGLRVLDTGTLLAYFSYEDEDGYHGLKDGSINNPDYLCIPENTESELIYNKKTYRYLNRFYDIKF